MTPEQITNKIQEILPDAKVITSGADCNFSIEVTSNKFAGKSTLQCHRIINDIFKQQLEEGVLHALSIKAQAPNK